MFDYYVSIWLIPRSAGAYERTRAYCPIFFFTATCGGIRAKRLREYANPAQDCE